jgi:alpha-mannosidase
MASASRHLVVVPHTHWDREWYRTFEEFRHRLVRVIDDVLDLLEADPEFRHFTLDGQCIVLDDYLEVRPQARERIEKRVREGRLLVGPWFVLPDEWLVSGEALIRNLRLGLRKAEATGGAMPIGYVPDQFGHVGQLPQIFAGFGLEGAVLWRGVGREIARTAFSWEAPDGTRLFTVYLPFGYGNAVHLPEQPEALAERLAFETQRLAAFSSIPTLLLMSGSDHVAPRRDLPQALAAGVAKLDGASFEIGTLPGFLRRARSESSDDLPVHRGELRSGLRAPLLPGCASSRMRQKRADFHNDRLLTRYLEPIGAWVAELGGDADPDVIDLAWRVALENHPHDSICGCSVDRVHDQMDTRFRRVEEIARAHLAQLGRELVSRVAVPAEGFGPGVRESLVVWNPNAAGRLQVESELELDLPLARGRVRPFHVRDASGRRLAASAEVLEGEEILADVSLPAAFATSLLPALGGEFAGLFVHAVSWHREGEQLSLEVRLGSMPASIEVRAIQSQLAAALSDSSVRTVAFRARRPPRLQLRFVDELPGYGLRVYRVASGDADSPRGAGTLVAERTAHGAAIANGRWRIEAAANGTIAFVSLSDGLRIEDAVRLVSEGDRGDEYNFDPVPGGEPVERPERVRIGVERPSQDDVALVVEGRYRVPCGLDGSRRVRSSRRVLLPVRLRLRLARALDRVDLEVGVDNRAEDHRLRLHLRAPFAARRFEVESAFEVVERPIAPDRDDFGSDRPAEFPVGTCPQRTFAAISDGRRSLTVANRGNAEVEAVRESDGSSSLALTLLRAVGWLSRDDLSLRPGNAGPALPTPGAQVPGWHHAEFSMRLHDDGDGSQIREAHGFAHPPIALLGGGSPDAPLHDGATLISVSEPALVVSAIEPRREGGAVLRLFNPSAEERRACVRWTGSQARTLEPVDLAERSNPSLECEAAGSAVRISVRPWQIVCLRVGHGPLEPGILR